MKISSDDYDYLKDLIARNMKRVGSDKLKEHYDNLKNDPRVKDIDKRYRWDLFYCVHMNERTELMDRLYSQGINDENFDRYLKSILKEVQS